MTRNTISFFLLAMLLALTGCAHDNAGPTNPGQGGNHATGKITGLKSDLEMSAFIGEKQYNITFDAKTGKFKGTLSRGGRADGETITGTFVCDKTKAGDDLYWYAHNSAICLKPDTATGSTGTDKNCYKIIADLTNTDATSKVTVNQYHTSTMTSADYTAAENSVKTTWDQSNDATTVTFTEKQKKCLTKANMELAKCTKKEVSGLTQTFDADGDATKDYTVGFSFNLGDTTCDVFIDKDNVAISTDNTSDFSRSTPTWLMDAVKTVIKTGASPDDLKDYSNLQSIVSELASAVGTSNDDVVYTESGKEGYQEIPYPWSEDELAKMKAFTENYASHKKEIGAYIHGYMSDMDKNSIQIVEKFSNDDAFAADSNGKRTKAELIYILSYSTITGFFPEGTYANDDEHVFGIKITVDLDGINALLPLNEWTNPSVIYDYFTFSKAEECSSTTEPITWRITSDYETHLDTIEPVSYYEETPQWFLDMITTYTSKTHSDYDRQFNIGGTGCPLSYIGSVWIDDICYEYLYGPGYNRYSDKKFIFDVYERDLTTDTYPSTATKQMEIKEIKALVSAGDYKAYTSAEETTEMANYWNDYESAAKDSDGHTLQDGVKPTSYTTTYDGQSPIYIKKKLNNIYILQWRGTNCRWLDNNMEPDHLWTISELKTYMAENVSVTGFKVYSLKMGAAGGPNADGIYQPEYDREILSFEENGMIRVFDNSSGKEMSFSTNEFYICPYSDPSPID